MTMIKKLLTGLLTVMMLVTSTLPAYAAVEDTGFMDVAADAWYADAVAYVKDNNLMSGTTETSFSPESNTSRAMLSTILYRMAGSPAVAAGPGFADVSADAYYATAVAWASSRSLVSGIGNDLFGSNDPVSREQIATILWRYVGSPEAVSRQDFADKNAIAAYATGAVDWARANGIVNGKQGNRFDPQGSATRVEVATILKNFLTTQQISEPNLKPETDDGRNILVVYYSATGSTEAVAKAIGNNLNADLFEIVPTNPYTTDDLNYTNASSRVSREHDDPALRQVELTFTSVSNWNSYDTVFIGYPIWWGIAAWPMDSFVSANDFTGKTVIPFATSASSDIGQSGELLNKLAGTGDWQSGQRFRSSVSDSDIRTWVNSLNLN